MKKIVFFAHPLFLGSQSMPRFVEMLADGMKKRGYDIEIWRPEARVSSIKVPGLQKWLGYIDQYLFFPQLVRKKLKKETGDVLYVITDHALGPYVPLIAKKPHVIHCHDFLAQRSALGEIPENVTSASGKAYQKFIKRGYIQGKNFISVSEKTRADLKEFLNESADRSEMVYNGLNSSFKPVDSISGVRKELTDRFTIDLTNGYILHVGGNQWYKNRVGVIDIYDYWRKNYKGKYPLILIGNQPNSDLQKRYEQSAYKENIHFLKNVSDVDVRMAYAGASVFVFPSLAEGFGWPVAEAMASGTLVITTNEAPMLEVAGDAAFLINRKPFAKEKAEQWAIDSAQVLHEALTLDPATHAMWIKKGSRNVERFKLDDALDSIEKIYSGILNNNS